MSENMLGNALRDSCGPLIDLLHNLEESDGEKWERALRRFLREENPWPASATSSQAQVSVEPAHELLNNCGPLIDYLQKFKGPNGRKWERALRRFLREENPWGASAAPFQTWVSLELGRYRNGRRYLRELERAGQNVGSWARDALLSRNFTCVTAGTTVDIVAVSLHDLGYKEGGVWFNNLIARGQEYGLVPCPQEVGPVLLLTRATQLIGESLGFVMKPIHHKIRTSMNAVKSETESYFRISRNDEGLGPVLNANEARYVHAADHVFGPDRLVFVQERLN